MASRLQQSNANIQLVSCVGCIAWCDCGVHNLKKGELRDAWKSIGLYTMHICINVSHFADVTSN